MSDFNNDDLTEVKLNSETPDADTGSSTEYATIPEIPNPGKPKPNRTLTDKILRGCAYVLIAAAIIVLLVFGACFIMLAGYNIDVH